jgi:hypothetical protein
MRHFERRPWLALVVFGVLFAIAAWVETGP